MPGALTGYSVQGNDFYAKVVSLKEYSSTFFKQNVDTWEVSYEEQTITTIDLLSLLNRLEQRGNTEENGTWMTLNSLDILASNHLIDLSLLLFKPPREFNYPRDTGINSIERQKIVCNLTPVDDPYWATEYLWKFFTDPAIRPIVAHKGICFPNPETHKQEDEYRWVFARPKPDARERLQKENLDKVWFKSKLFPSERFQLQDEYWDGNNAGGFVFPEDAVVINDGTICIHPAEDWSDKISGLENN